MSRSKIIVPVFLVVLTSVFGLETKAFGQGGPPGGGNQAPIVTIDIPHFNAFPRYQPNKTFVTSSTVGIVHRDANPAMFQVKHSYTFFQKQPNGIYTPYVGGGDIITLQSQKSDTHGLFTTWNGVPPDDGDYKAYLTVTCLGIVKKSEPVYFNVSN